MRRVGAALGALALGGIGVLATAVPAFAAFSYIQVCNSSDGNANIRVWKTDSSYSNTLFPTGQCTGDLYNVNNSVRVDTTEGHSYKIKDVTGNNTYGPCHIERTNSDPPNGGKVYYKNFKFNSNCT